MSKNNVNNRANVFIYEGKFMETDTLIDVRAEASLSDWENIVRDTVDYYATMVVMDRANQGVMETKDRRLMRRLLQTIETIKKIDPRIMEDHDVTEVIKKKDEELRRDLQALGRVIRVARGKGRRQGVDVVITQDETATTGQEGSAQAG
jgi:hypothetical protein